MNSSSVEPEQWTYKQRSNSIEESEFVINQYDHVGDRLSDKYRCDDAVSSSATHGSVSTLGASRRQISDCRADTSPTSDGKVTYDGGNGEFTCNSSPDSSARTHMFAGKALPTNCSSGEDRSYSLNRFLRDIDPREEARLRVLSGIDRGRSRERRENGAGRWRERRSNSRAGHHDQTRVVEEGEEEQENDGAA